MFERFISWKENGGSELKLSHPLTAAARPGYGLMLWLSAATCKVARRGFNSLSVHAECYLLSSTASRTNQGVSHPLRLHFTGLFHGVMYAFGFGRRESRADQYSLGGPFWKLWPSHFCFHILFNEMC